MIKQTRFYCIFVMNSSNVILNHDVLYESVAHFGWDDL